MNLSIFLVVFLYIFLGFFVLLFLGGSTSGTVTPNTFQDAGKADKSFAPDKSSWLSIVKTSTPSTYQAKNLLSKWPNISTLS